MDDLFPILLFVIFFLLPMLQGVKNRNKQPPPQQRRRPRQAPQQRLPQARPPSRTEEVATRSREQDSAATMVPDDLWEILTGQKRAPVPTSQPQPAPAEGKERPYWDVVYEPDEEEEEADEESLIREDVDVEQHRVRREPVSLETLERHPQPVVVSLEENIPTVAQRHAAFHEKVIATQMPATVVPDRPRRARRLHLGNRNELQRAFLLQEVLGKPRSLQ